MKRIVAVLGAAFVASLGGVGLLQAADLPEPPPVYVPEPEFGGWYLRGHIGISNQRVDEIYNVLFETTTVVVEKKDFRPAGILGVGAGYQFNKWFRADVTAEHRFNSKFRGFDRYSGPPGNFGTNDYDAKKSEWLFLANAYVDIATWKGFTPYVGAGIGFSRNTIKDFVDVNAVTGGGGTGGNYSKWNVAWALHAGVGYEINPNFTVDLAYRFVHLGNARTKDIINFDGTNFVYNPMEFRKLTSHDVMLSLRWNLSPRASIYDSAVYADAGYGSYDPYPAVVKH